MDTSNGNDCNPAGFTAGTAYAVNDSGVSVGNETAYNATGGHLGTAPTRWEASGNVSQLGTLGSLSAGTFFGVADSVNSAGTAVGVSTDYNSSGTSIGNRATIWAAGTTAAVELPNLGTNAGGSTTTQALSINDDGLAVGSAFVFVFNIAGVGHGPAVADAGHPVVGEDVQVGGRLAGDPHREGAGVAAGAVRGGRDDGDGERVAEGQVAQRRRDGSGRYPGAVVFGCGHGAVLRVGGGW